MPDGAALIRPTLARMFTPPSGKKCTSPQAG